MTLFIMRVGVLGMRGFLLFLGFFNWIIRVQRLLLLLVHAIDRAIRRRVQFRVFTRVLAMIPCVFTTRFAVVLPWRFTG